MRIAIVALAVLFAAPAAKKEVYVGEREYAELAYQQRVVDAVHGRWRRDLFTMSYKMYDAGEKFVTKVDVVVGAKGGKPLSVTLTQKCGAKKFDKAVLRAFKDVSLPAPPVAILDGGSVTLHGLAFIVEIEHGAYRAGIELGDVKELEKRPPSDGKWREATSPHFRVVGDASETEIRGVALEFERIRALMRSSVVENRDVAEPTVPIVVYVARTPEQFAELAPGAFAGRTMRVGGLYQRNPVGIDLFVLLDEFGEGADLGQSGPTVRHEYHHMYFDRTAPGAPLWLREGLAEVWSTATPVSDGISLGKVERREIERLQKTKLVPIREIFAVTPESPYYREEDAASVFYAESFLLAHFLEFMRPSEQMSAFLTHVRDGVGHEEAATKAWGDLEELQGKFEAYVANGVLPSQRWALTEPIPESVEIAVREVPESRVLATKAWLLAIALRRIDALMLAGDALKLDPNDTVALEARGLVAFTSDDKKSASADFEKAVAQPDARYSAHYLAAISARDGKSGERLQRALELAPRFSPALVAKAIFTKDKAEAEALARKAVDADPADPMIGLRAARVLRRIGKKPDAADLARRSVTQVVNIGDARENARVCLYGALDGFAVKAACEQAVKLAPENADAREARAVARTLTRSYAGAADDVRWLMQREEDAKRKASFGKWLEGLTAHKNQVDWNRYFKLLEDPLL